MRPQAVVLRHEDVAGRVVTGFGQVEAERLGFGSQEIMRDLNEDASAVARQRIGADRAAVFKVRQDAQSIFDDLVRFGALEVSDETDAASVVLAGRVVKTLGARTARRVEHLVIGWWQYSFAHLKSSEPLGTFKVGAGARARGPFASVGKRGYRRRL